MKLESYFQRLVLVIFGTLVGVLPCEIILRNIPNPIGYVDNGLIRIPWFAAEHDFHPQIGFWPKPNQTFRRQTSCYDLQVNLNENGIRENGSANQQSKHDKIKIAVVGDSMMQALQVSDSEHFSAILERLIPNSEVRSYAASSIGTIQEMLVIKHLVSEFSPDIVIHAIFAGNDLADNNKDLLSCYVGRNVSSERPFYTENNLSYPKRYVPTLRYSDSDTWLGKLQNILIDESFVFNAILKAMPAKQYDKTASATKLCNFWPHNKDLVPLAATTPPLTTQWQTAWHDTIRSIKESKQTVAQWNGAYFVLPIPEQELNLHSYSKIALRHHFDIPPNALNYVTDRLSNELQQNGINVISIKQLFEEYKSLHLNSSIHPFSFSCDAHWNPLGHALAAIAVVDQLSHKNLLDLNSTQFSGIWNLEPQEILGAASFAQIYQPGIYTGRSNVRFLGIDDKELPLSH